MSRKQDVNGKVMRIGQLAQATGVSAKTIRFYEETSVLPPARRAANGYRQYDESDAQRLCFIRFFHPPVWPIHVPLI